MKGTVSTLLIEWWHCRVTYHFCPIGDLCSLCLGDDQGKGWVPALNMTNMNSPSLQLHTKLPYFPCLTLPVHICSTEDLKGGRKFEYADRQTHMTVLWRCLELDG